VAFPSPVPDVGAGRPLPSTEQLAAQFRDGIRDGTYAVGERLPTIREVAERVGVTRNAVQLAYRQLAAEGLVESTVGRGTVVAGEPRGRGPGLSRSARAAWRAMRAAPLLPRVPDEVPVVADFAGLQPDDGMFPTDRFRAALDEALASSGGRLPGYGDPAGNRALREALAARHARAGHADPERILITTGAQQGIDLVLRTFAEPGDAVAVAVPTYPQLFGSLAAHGLELVPVEAEDGVADLRSLRAALARPDVRLLYVMPTFHNPTGASLDPSQRAALMDVVAATDVPVLEDEYECELRFEGDELPALSSLDPRGLTVTVRSFSKGMFPGVRLGWVEGAADVLGPMTALKRYSDLESSPFLQDVIGQFLRAGAMDEYLAELRLALRTRHQHARELIARTFPEGVRVMAPEGGLALWLAFPLGTDVDRIAEASATEGVLVTPGRAFDPSGRPSRGLRISLSRVDVDTIARGLSILARHAHAEAAGSTGGPSSSPLPIL
jgi:DNA-binding transcriptional MocR family regulator